MGLLKENGAFPLQTVKQVLVARCFIIWLMESNVFVNRDSFKNILAPLNANLIIVGDFRSETNVVILIG